MINSVVIKPNDNVATATEALKAGDIGRYLLNGVMAEVTVLEDIPQYHKYAVKDVEKGGYVYKYGEKIGRATADIKCGMYVHVHNVESERA